MEESSGLDLYKKRPSNFEGLFLSAFFVKASLRIFCHFDEGEISTRSLTKI